MAAIVRIIFIITALLNAGTASLATEHLKWGAPKITKKKIPYGECISLVTEAENWKRAGGLYGKMSMAEFGLTFTKRVNGLNTSAQIVAKRTNEGTGTITNTVTSLECKPKYSHIEKAVSLAVLTPKARALKEKKEGEARAAKAKLEMQARETLRREKERLKMIEAMEEAANKAFAEGMAKPIEEANAKKILPQESKNNAEQPLRIREIDLVRQQIRECWNLPAGAKDAKNLRIEIRMVMNSDGTVRQARIIDQDRLNRDSFFRSAAESVLRAVLNPRCNPLKLPPEKYLQWKNMTLIFDPSLIF